MAERRRGIPWGLRIFLAAAVPLAIAALGAGILLQLALGERRGEESADQTLTAGHAAYVTFEQELFARLRTAARLLAREGDLADFAASPEPRRRANVVELLENRAAEEGLDLVSVLGPRGEPLLAIPRAALDPTSARARSRPQPTGVWRQGDRLWLAVAEPLVKDFDLTGHLVAGLGVDEVLAHQLARVTGREVAIATVDGTSLETVTGSSSLAGNLVAALAADARAGLSAGDGPLLFEPAAAGRTYRALVAPLPSGADPVPAALVLFGPRGTERPVRFFLLSLLALTAASLAAAAVASALAGRSIATPLRRLTDAVEAARRGEPAPSRLDAGGAAGPLAGSLSALLGDLDQRRALEKLAREAVPGRDDSSVDVGRDRATSGEAALLGVELKGGARGGAAVARLRADLVRIRTAVASRGGRIETVAGQRVLASFRGQERSHRAFAAAAEVLETALHGAEPGQIPALALACGPVAEGWLFVHGQEQPVTLGLPVQQVESLLREAGPGDLLLTEEAHRELDDQLRERGVRAVAQRGILTPQPLHALDAGAAVRAAGLLPQSERPSAPPEPGEVVAQRFELRAVLGVGSFGKLYRAHDRELARPVALLVFTVPELTEPATLGAASAAVKPFDPIRQENSVRILDFGLFGIWPCLVREHVEGQPLAHFLDRHGPLPALAALAAARQAAAGLAAVHAGGLFHGRLEPGSVFLEAAGRVRIAGFGVAMVAAAAGLPPPPATARETPYRAPEQQRGEWGDSRSDVYAWGVLTCRLFIGASSEDEPARAAAGQLPEPLREVVHRCLRVDPAERYPHSGALVADLDRLGRSLG